MKKLIYLLLLVVIGCGRSQPQADIEGKQILDVADYPALVNTGQVKEDTLKGSPIRISELLLGNTAIKITYGSPGVRNRIIWGGLVPFDQVWVSGAHNATSITFGQDVAINGVPIPAGTYALFTIPGKENWQVIINKNFRQHLADQYDKAEDLVRVVVTPSTLTETVPRLTYEVKALNESAGTISMCWEKLKLELPFKTIKQ